METFREILVPVDFSEPSDEAFRFALLWARHYDAHIHVMHDIEIPTETITGATIIREEMEEAYAESEQRMTELTQIREADGVTMRAEILRSTEPKRSILNYAEEHEIDLLVLGTHGRTGRVEKVIGSTAERVLRRSPAPCIVVSATNRSDSLDRVVVPVDFSEYSEKALGHALEIADVFGAELILLHSAPDDPPSDVERRLRDLYEQSGRDSADTRFVAAADDVEPAVNGAALKYDADLIVMVTHGRTGLRRALTSNVAESVIRRAPCPVLTYRTELEK